MIAVLTPMGASLCGGTHHDLVAVKNSREDIALCSLSKAASLQDRLIGGCKDALALGARKVAIIEADMRVPADAIIRLDARHLDIVGANYPQRQQGKWTAISQNGRYVSSTGRTGIERVMRLGCGVLMIDARVLRGLPQPWFSAPWMPEHGVHLGIDYYFCQHAEAHGFWSWVDHDLSQDVRHIAEVELTVNGPCYLTSDEAVSEATR